MLTFFTTAKPFRGHIDVIQRNAIRSWSLIHPEAEVILFGDDEGAAEVARELGIRHEPQVERNENGTKYLGSIYDRAHEIARREILCYVNCDIVLMSDFRYAVERLCEWRRTFLMIGRRWDLDVTQRMDFERADWEQELRSVALREGKQRPPDWIDYFVFWRGLYYQKIPPFVIGRPGWDNWLVWYARAARTRVVDASEVVTAVHQNHDYSYHPEGEVGVWSGEEARRNRALLRGWMHIGTVEDATHRLAPETIKRKYRHWVALGRRAWNASVRRLLEMSLPVRHSLGLTRDRISAFVPRKK
jgi:hypothetical protein